MLVLSSVCHTPLRSASEKYVDTPSVRSREINHIQEIRLTTSVLTSARCLPDLRRP